MSESTSKHWESSDEIEDTEPTDNSPASIFMHACGNGKVDIVKEFLVKNPDLVNISDSDKYTPLHRAAYSNNPEIIQELLSFGATVSATSIDNWTPLHSACRWSNYECAALLVDAGADVNAVTSSGQTPLHIASMHSTTCSKTLQLLLMCPFIKSSLLNNNGESAKQLGVSNTPFGYLFEATDEVLLFK